MPTRWSGRTSRRRPRTTPSRLSRTSGEARLRIALFDLGFRPFYLLAGGYAALGVPIWAMQYAGWLPGANALWHAHEMLFGYAFAVIAGFLLTAVRNWTGRATPHGPALAALASVWVCARLLAHYSLLLGAVADMAFAVGVAWAIGKPLVASDNRRNWFFIALVLAIGAASILFQAFPAAALALGLDLVLFIMAVIAGRVIPGFTNNAVPAARARRNSHLERGALGALFLMVAADLLSTPTIAALAAMVAAVLHGWRLALWSPLSTVGRPILWILHASYAWIVVHLALRGLAGFGLVSTVLATHALTVGAIGGMTLGMMTRTARGHTGRPLRVGNAELIAYLLVQGAAAVRVLVPLAAPGAYAASVGLSAFLWSAAFALFTVTYFPILSGPRLDGRPG